MPISHRWVNTVSGLSSPLSASCPNTRGAVPKSRTIAIIREEDNPKTRLMERFGLNENQANAILDMRLRSLRKLEEMEIRGEREKLEEEKTGLTSLLADEDQQRRSVARDVKSLKTDFARIDQRRTRLDSVPEVEGDPMDMLVEKEPITVICSEKGWIRAAKGHLASDAEVKFKEGDGPAFMVHAETTDRILVAADNGRFYTLSADKLPGGRGFGEPVSLMVELGADTTIINLFPARGGEILIVADTGHGFITATDQVMAQTRNGKQVLTLPKGVKAAVARPAIGDMVAVVGSNRKLLVFPRDDLPVMGRGRGVMLQRYRDGTLGDARCFNRADGLSWVQSGGRNRTEPDTTPWQGKRGSAGRVAPTGFPRPARFT